MTDPVDHVLRLVAEGRLTAEQAAPILDALAGDEPGSGEAGARTDEAAPRPEASGTRPPTAIRIEITEDGRRVVNLRIPVSLGRMALDRIPGLAGTHADLVRRALADGRSGTLLSIDEESGGVRIVLE